MPAEVKVAAAVISSRSQTPEPFCLGSKGKRCITSNTTLAAAGKCLLFRGTPVLERGFEKCAGIKRNLQSQVGG